jgi:hypothetical protein
LTLDDRRLLIHGSRGFGHSFLGLDHGVGHFAYITLQPRNDSTLIRVAARQLPLAILSPYSSNMTLAG